MDELVIGLYVLTLIACCVSLWLWYEIDSTNSSTIALKERIRDLDTRIEELERKRR